jgi:hypothetical protein
LCTSGFRLILAGVPDHDPTRTDRLAAYQRAQAADRATHDDALIIIDRWNSALASGRATLWSPTIGCAVLAGMPWLGVHRPGFARMPKIVGLHPLPPAANVRASGY